MAMAVQRAFPGVQVTTGPWIDNGFYYDFYNPKSQFSDDDLVTIKKEMDKIIKKNYPLVCGQSVRTRPTASFGHFPAVPCLTA